MDYAHQNYIMFVKNWDSNAAISDVIQNLWHKNLDICSFDRFSGYNYEDLSLRSFAPELSPTLLVIGIQWIDLILV